MEESRTTPAVILNRTPYRESDLLVSVYTPIYGKLLLVARGALKPQSKLAAHLEPLNLADIMIITGRSFDYIGSAVSRNIYYGVRDDLNKLYYAGRVLNLLNKLIQLEQGDEHIFLLLMEVLDILDSFINFTKEDGSLLIVSFTLSLLTALGYRPELQHCLNCLSMINPGTNHFNLLNGGLVCETCTNQIREQEKRLPNHFYQLSDDVIKILRFISVNDLKQNRRLRVNHKLIKELSLVVDQFVNFRF